MFNRIIFLLAVVVGGWGFYSPVYADVEEIEVTPEVRFRAKTFTRESDPIINPIPWVQFREMRPEGTRVREGDVVFRLDLKGVNDHASRLDHRLEETKNSAAQKLSSMQKTVSELEDKRSEKLDQKKIQVARKTYLKSLPVEADVEIAKGRLEVAMKNLQASEEELAKSKLRLEKELISPAMLQEDLQKVAEQKARALYAEQMLRVTELPAHPLEIEIVEYRIRNLDLEIDKLAKEIPIQKKILEIETSSQERRLEDLSSQRAEREEELKHEYLYAPADGVLMYAPQFKRELTTGGKASKGMELAIIPRRESMALEGVIPEQLRHLFSVGDPAEVRLNIFPNRPLRGKISSIAPFSRDAVEGDTSSGVKIVDVVVEMEEIPEDLPLGVYGWVTISTGSPVSGWSVPASWIRYRGGKAHVSVNGVMEPVNGILHKDRYLLSSPHPPAESITEEGTWSQTDDPGLQLVTDQFIATGELIPFESLILDTPRVRSWDMQIAWLVDENSQVKKGDVLVRLESEMMTNDLENRQLDVKRYRGERESAEEELEIRRSENDYQLASAKNRIEIKKRERDLVFRSGSASEMIQTQLSLTQAGIQLEKAEEALSRNIRNAEWASETERKKLERDVSRRELEMEKAEINYKLAREGAEDVEKSMAELDLLKEEASTAELTAQQYRALSRAQSQLRWRKSREENSVSRLKRHEEDLESMQVKAPAAGLVKFLKIWDGVRESKIKTGMKVWRGMQLISLSSADKLFVEVSVPERYIRHLKPDMKVSVRIPSEGGMQWKGKIIQQEEILEPAGQTITTQSIYGDQEQTQEQVLKIRVLIETGEDTTLKPGAIAQIIFPFEK